MVEVECPLCTEAVDLGVAEEGAYVCPYCEDEFYWEPDEFLDSDDIKAEIIWPENTVLLGKVPSSEALSKIVYSILFILFTFLTAGVFTLMWWASHDRRQDKKKMDEMREEYSRGVLNREFIKGPGLLLYPNQECELLTEYDRPNHHFSSADITGIHLELNATGHMNPHGSEWKYSKKSESNSDIILNIEGIPTMTMTFGHKRWKEAERTAQKLSKLLDMEYEGYENIWQSNSDGFSKIVQSRQIK